MQRVAPENSSRAFLDRGSGRDSNRDSNSGSDRDSDRGRESDSNRDSNSDRERKKETDTAAAAVTCILFPRTSFLITCASMFHIDFRREAERGR